MCDIEVRNPVLNGKVAQQLDVFFIGQSMTARDIVNAYLNGESVPCGAEVIGRVDSSQLGAVYGSEYLLVQMPNETIFIAGIQPDLLKHTARVVIT